MIRELNLSIAEAVLLIALDDEYGHIASPVLKRMPYVLSTAIVFDLYLREHLLLKNNEIEVVNQSGTGLKILDEGLKNLPKKRLTLKSALSNLEENCGKNFIKIATDMLLSRGILEKKREHIFGLPVAERLDNANYTFEESLRKQISAFFASQVEEVPSDFLVFLTLLSCSNLFEEVFLHNEEIITARHHLQEVLRNQSQDKELKTALLRIHHEFLNPPPH